MALTVKKNTAVAITIESVEGVYQAPASAADFVQVLADGFELTQSKDVIERNVFTGSIGKTSPRTGAFQSAGTAPVEMRANSVEGSAPESDKLLRSALGARRQISSTTTTGTGNTGSELQIDDLDIGKFNIGDIILIKQAGAFHVSPIIAIDDSIGTANITLLVAKPTGSFSDGVVIAKSSVYTVADAGHPSLSISKYIEGAVLEACIGAKATGMSIENFSTGQIPTMSFGVEGLNFDRSLTPIPFTPAYDSGLPPIMLDGRVYQDGVALCINELTLSLENTLGFVTCINAENGRVSSRATDRTISGTFNPYKQDDDISNFTKYKNNTPFTLFAYGKINSTTPGEFSGIVAVYMPNCLITELGEADQDGILQETISFSSDRGATGDIPELYMAFI